MIEVKSEIVHPDKMAWQDRRIKTGHETAEDLARWYNRDNWRGHPEVQRLATEESLDTLGWVGAIKLNVQGDTRRVIDGHLRIEIALLKDPEQLLPVDYYELTQEEENFALTYLDTLTGEAETLPHKLSALLEKTRGMVGDREGLGEVRRRQMERVRELLGRNGEGLPETPPAQINRAEELQKKWQVQSGDLFEIGPHRLLCGDCRNPDDVRRLMGREKADMVFTDPPYNVEIVGGTRDPRDKKNYQSGNYIENDSMSDVEFDTFLFEAMQSLYDAMSLGCVFYVCSPAGNTETQFRNAINKVFTLRQCIVWVKQQFVFGRQDYHWRHESILYGWKEGAAHFFGEDHTQDTVWEIDRPMRSDKEHPTVKPVELPMRAIRNSSKEGYLVYDPFAGSGTTALAAHTLNRRSASVEIHPPYVAVTLERFEQAGLSPAKAKG